MDSAQMTKLAVAAGILFAAYKWGPGWAKAMALGVAGTIVAKQVPYVNEVI